MDKQNIRLVEPKEVDKQSLQVSFIQYMLTLISATSSIRLHRPIPVEDLIETCERIGIHPVPDCEHDAVLSLITVAPGLMRVFRAPHDCERAAFDGWKRAVTNGNHGEARAWLIELGLAQA